MADVEGLYNINKPRGITSFDVVFQMRKTTGVKKIGHAGTLDPLAEGVLVVAVGRENTKQISDIVEKEKEYVGEFTLGITATTDDEEGEKTPVSDRVVVRDEVEAALKEFVGEIMQRPPAFSAIKKDGKRAYKLARSGEDVKLEPRPVLIKEVELVGYSYPIVTVRLVTGPGVYVRAVARDLGEKLGVGAYMSALTRTRVGSFRLEDAKTLDEIKNEFKK